MSPIRTIIVTALTSTTLLAGGAGAGVYYRASPQVITNPPKNDDVPDGGVENETLKLTADAGNAVRSYGYGAPWDIVVDVSGGVPPYSYRLAQGTRPSGIVFGTSGGTTGLKGRTGEGSWGPFTIEVSDAAGSVATAAIDRVEVSPPDVAPSLSSTASSMAFPKGETWSVPFLAKGGIAPYTYAVPHGLSAIEDPSSGVTIRGAGIAGSYTIPSIAVTDALGTEGVASTPVRIVVGTEASLMAVQTATASATPTGGSDAVVRVVNTGDLPSTSTPVVTVSSGPFSIVSSDCGEPLAGGSSCSTTLRASASVNGDLTGTASVAGMPGTIALSGTASGFDPAPTLSASTIMASTSTGSTIGVPVLTTLTNTGYSTSGIATIALADTTYFALSGGSCDSGTTILAPNASCTVGIVRKAQTNDTGRSTVLNVTFAAGGSSSASVTGTASGFAVLSLAGTSGTVTVANGAGMSQTYAASGGLAPYSFRHTGTLPSGISGTSSEREYNISGSSMNAGNYPQTITVTDASGATAEISTTIQVAEKISMIANHTKLTFTSMSQTQTVNITVSNTTAFCNMSLNKSSLNDYFDLTISPGNLNGTTQIGTVSFTSKKKGGLTLSAAISCPLNGKSYQTNVDLTIRF